MSSCLAKPLSPVGPEQSLPRQFCRLQNCLSLPYLRLEIGSSMLACIPKQAMMQWHGFTLACGSHTNDCSCCISRCQIWLLLTCNTSHTQLTGNTSHTGFACKEVMQACEREWAACIGAALSILHMSPVACWSACREATSTLHQRSLRLLSYVMLQHAQA